MLWAQLTTKDYISGLKTNFSLSPTYSFHKLWYQMFLLLKPRLKFCPQFRKANPGKQKHMFWSLFIFRGHSTREPASSRVTYFILLTYTWTGVSHSQRRFKDRPHINMPCICNLFVRSPPFDPLPNGMLPPYPVRAWRSRPPDSGFSGFSLFKSGTHVSIRVAPTCLSLPIYLVIYRYGYVSLLIPIRLCHSSIGLRTHRPTRW